MTAQKQFVWLMTHVTMDEGGDTAQLIVIGVFSSVAKAQTFQHFNEDGSCQSLKWELRFETVRSYNPRPMYMARDPEDTDCLYRLSAMEVDEEVVGAL